jgi:hypothetical protein
MPRVADVVPGAVDFVGWLDAGAVVERRGDAEEVAGDEFFVLEAPGEGDAVPDFVVAPSVGASLEGPCSVGLSAAISVLVGVNGSPTRPAAPKPTLTDATANASHSATSTNRLFTWEGCVGVG